MILTYEQWLDHNKTFWESMVDLKVEGWKSYSKATNAYTNSFFKKQLYQADQYVEKLGATMKGKTV